MESPEEHDRSLLRAFADEGSQDAFTELVTRHTGLVYGTALRKTDNPTLAEEAAQNTFAILCRKAGKLAGHPAPLAAWLHRTATYEAAKRLRSESRHRRKMDALEDQQQSVGPHGQAGGSLPALHPHLDDAIGKLPDADRQLVLLHHYQGVQLKDIASLSGKSPAAVQKQHQRALAKLAHHLRRAGAPAASVTLLAAALSTNLQTAAPAALAPALASSALSTAPAVSLAALITNTIVTMSTKKLAALSAAAVLLVSAVPLGVQRVAIAGARTEIASLENRNSDLRGEHGLPPAPAAGAKRTGVAAFFDAPDPTGGRASAIDIVAFADDVHDARDKGSFTIMARVMRTAQSVAKMPDSQLDQLFARVADAGLSETKRYYVTEALLRGLADERPAKALELAAGILRDAPASFHSRYVFLVTGPLRKVAESDPDAALAFYQNATETDLFASRALNARDHLQRDASSSLFAGLLNSDKAKALELYATLPHDDARTDALRRGASDFIATGDVDTHLELTRTLGSGGARRQAYGDLAEAYARKHRLGDKTVAFVENLGLDDRDTSFALRKAAFSQAYNPGSDLDDHLAWVREHSPDGHADENVGAVLGNYARFNNQRQKSLDKLEKLRGAGAPDSVITAYLANSDLIYGDPNRSLELIGTITDEPLHAEAMEQFTRYWKRSPEQMQEYFRKAGIDSVEVHTTTDAPQ